MALVDHKRIMDGIIKYCREILDGQLSEMPTVFGSMPSVIADRSKSPRPDFPYIVVDRKNSNQEQTGWAKNIRTDINDITHFESEQRISINVTCFGENADNILNHLRQSFLWDFNRYSLNNETDAYFQFCSDISEKPLFMETDFVDGAEMDIIFLAVSDFEVANSVIETVEVKGQFKEGSEDPTPIITEFTIHFEGD